MHFLVPSLTFLAIGGFTLPISGGFTLRNFGGAKLLITNVIETTTYSIQEAVFAVKEKISSGAALLS